VATHIKLALAGALDELIQLFHANTAQTANPASTQRDFMRILLPRREFQSYTVAKFRSRTISAAVHDGAKYLGVKIRSESTRLGDADPRVAKPRNFET
jgi:hypothetical protein